MKVRVEVESINELTAFGRPLGDVVEGCLKVFLGRLAKDVVSNADFMPAGVVASDLKSANTYYDASAAVRRAVNSARKAALVLVRRMRMDAVRAANGLGPFGIVADGTDGNQDNYGLSLGHEKNREDLEAGLRKVQEVVNAETRIVMSNGAVYHPQWMGELNKLIDSLLK